jgi:hypothetical protein
MKTCVFESLYGFNNIFRLGKIYHLTTSHYNYIMRTNCDLLDYSYVFKLFFRRVKQNLKIKILRKCLTFDDLNNRQLGLCTIHSLIEQYYISYFSDKHARKVIL